MKKISLQDINILDVGNKYSLAGSVWSGQGRSFLALLPDAETPEELEILEMDVPDWQRFLRQSDILETEILKDDGNGIKKAIVRKSQRLIDSHIQIQVWKRDKYTCRYCGKDDVSLTIDHCITWESGGISTPENLLTSCRKCNKQRGSTPYENWIKSMFYEVKSKDLPEEIKKKNLELIDKLDYLRSLKVENIRSR